MSLKVAPVIFVVYPVDKEGSFGTLRNASEQQLAEEGGIRTHVEAFAPHPISSRCRYGRFGTSPEDWRLYT